MYSSLSEQQLFYTQFTLRYEQQDDLFVCSCEGKQIVILSLWDKNYAHTEFYLMRLLIVRGACCKHSASLILLCIIKDNFYTLARTRIFTETCANEMIEIRGSENQTSSLWWSVGVCKGLLCDNS